MEAKRKGEGEGNGKGKRKAEEGEEEEKGRPVRWTLTPVLPGVSRKRFVLARERGVVVVDDEEEEGATDVSGLFEGFDESMEGLAALHMDAPGQEAWDMDWFVDEEGVAVDG